VVKAVKKRLQHKDPKVQFLTLTVRTIINVMNICCALTIFSYLHCLLIFSVVGDNDEELW